MRMLLVCPLPWWLCLSAWSGWLVAGEPTSITIEPALLTIAEQVEVPARDVGLLQVLAVREGQQVAAGDLLAKLDDGEAKLAHAKARTDLQRGQKLAANDIQVRHARLELDQAKVEFQRALDALQRLPNSVSATELDRLRTHGRKCILDLEQAQFDLDAAQLSVQLLENELQLSADRLQRRQIATPLAGVIVSLPKRQGEWVEAGQVVARVVAIDRLRVEFFLTAQQATADLVGRNAEFRLMKGTGATDSYPGRITLVGTEVDPLNGQIRMRAEVDNRDGRLRPGLAGTLIIGPGP